MRRHKAGLSFVLLIVLALPQLLMGQKETPALSPAPADAARHGVPVRFEYMPRVPCSAVRLVYFSNLLVSPKTLDMKFKEDGSCLVTHTFSDTSIHMLLYAFECDTGSAPGPMLDNNSGLYWDILFVDAKGIPVRNALLKRSLSYTGYSRTRKEDLPLAMQAVEKELAHYPDNTQARLHGYTLQIRINQNSNRIRDILVQETINELKKKPRDPKNLAFVVDAFRLLGQVKEAERVEKQLIQLDPKGEKAAGQSFDRIMQDRSDLSKIQKLENFLVEYPSSSYSEHALSAMGSMAIQMDDTSKMIQVGDRLLFLSSSPGAASSLAGIAGTLVERRTRFDKAFLYIEKALSLIRATKDTPPPPDISVPEWNERILVTEARYLDILGWSLIQSGQTEKGIQELKTAVQGTSQPGVHYHLGIAYQKMNDPEKALEHFGRAAAFEGDISELAYDALESLWEQSGRVRSEMDPFLREQARIIQDQYRQRVLAARSIRRAPNFELESLDGNWVRLSDQKEPVVLIFWATWSRSSRQIIEILETVAASFQEVLFLAISTDVDVQDLDWFVQREAIDLPVLLNDGTDQDYGVKGLPTVFVLDPKGRIHFEHKGFTDDFEQRLNLELEDLLENESRP